MPAFKNNRYVPFEHREIYKQLFTDLLSKVLFISLKKIQRSEAEVICEAIYKAIRYKFSSKQMEKLIREVAQNDDLIIKPRPGTLNLLSQFVLGEYENNSTPQYINDKRPFWIMYIIKNSSLIANDNIRDNMIDLPTPEEISQKKFPVLQLLPHNDIRHIKQLPIAKYYKVYDMEIISIFDKTKVKKMQWQAALYGGFAIGITNALLLIFAPGRVSGYWNAGNNLKINLVPLITSANILCGLSTGILICGFFGRPTYINTHLSVINKFEKIIVTILAFIIMIFFRQLASRDLIVRGSFDLQIDLETFCYCIVGSVGIIDTLKLMRSNYIIPGFIFLENIAITSIKISLIMIVIYGIYHFVIEASKWHNYIFPDHSFVYLKLDFPQPGRMLLVCLIIFLNMNTLIGLRNLYFKYKLKYLS